MTADDEPRSTTSDSDLQKPGRRPVLNGEVETSDDDVDRAQIHQQLAMEPDERLASVTNISKFVASTRSDSVLVALDAQCLLVEFDKQGVDYVLIGSLAAVLHGSTAMTNQADILPDADPDNLERLGAALTELQARLRVDGDPEGVAFDPHPSLIASMAMLNLTTRCGDLDLTFTPSGLDGYTGVRGRAVAFEVGGLHIHVAALPDIIASKQAAGRPKDHATLPILHALQEEIDNSDQKRKE